LRKLAHVIWRCARGVQLCLLARAARVTWCVPALPAPSCGAPCAQS
jgi:hypothetical protein